MDNPLEQDAPDDMIERVHAFARDLAWGALYEKWGTSFRVASTSQGEQWFEMSRNRDWDENLNGFFLRKWNWDIPVSGLLLSFGYFEADFQRSATDTPAFALTQQAFRLLEKPAIPPKIFISYRQNESSAFASLIEARLNIAAPEAGVFIDKLLEGGDEWEQRIEHEIRERDTFICVYGPDTPKSTMIPKEIAWAQASGSRIIPVLHNEFTRDCEGYPEQFKALQDITVEKESAEAYELAILKLLNTLGYPTLQSPRPEQRDAQQ